MTVGVESSHQKPKPHCQCFCVVSSLISISNKRKGKWTSLEWVQMELIDQDISKLLEGVERSVGDEGIAKEDWEVILVDTPLNPHLLPFSLYTNLKGERIRKGVRH